MHNLCVDVTLNTLQKRAAQALHTQSVTAVLLALGSNHQAAYYLPRVRDHLATLGAIKQSTAFQNPDFTATAKLPKPDYTNQCIYLSLSAPMTVQQLQQACKGFESLCGRQRDAKRNASVKRVTMDIDILLVKLAKNKNSLSSNLATQWIIMAERYPLKAHEAAGIEELITKGCLS